MHVGRGQAVRFAVVGLGYFAQNSILPAFKNTKGTALVALVSDDATKRRELGQKYDVPYRVGYDEYDDLLRSGQVDAVYIALPNDLHAEYAMRAARHGVHVLCEKPLAVTSHDARRMIEACKRAGVRLMTAYRLHFEPANLRAIDAIDAGHIGEPRYFSSQFSMQVREGNIRTQAERGGGPLHDIGVYCVNAARYLFRDEPVSVVAEAAAGKDKRFREVDAMVSAILTFPGGRHAAFTASFGAHDVASYTVVGTKGVLCVDNAYEHSDPRFLEVEGEKSYRKRALKWDQVAPELMHFADCIRDGKDPEPSGKEGLIDVAILEAIARSARTGRRVAIRVPNRRRRPTLDMAVRVGRDHKVDLIHARPASK